MVGGVYDQISILVDHFRKKDVVKQVILFGSFARNSQQKESDIDLCIITDESHTRRLDIMRQLRRAIAQDVSVPVDIVIYPEREFEERAEHVSTFEYHIKKEGIKLHG